MWRGGTFYYAQEVQHKTRLCEFRTLIFCAPHHFAVFTLESYIKKSKDYFDSSQSLFTFRSFLDSFKVNFSSISRSMGSFFGFCLCPFQVHLRSIQVLSRSSFSPYQVFFRSIFGSFKFQVLEYDFTKYGLFEYSPPIFLKISRVFQEVKLSLSTELEKEPKKGSLRYMI